MATPERTWDRVFKRNLEAADKLNTDVNIELEKEWPGGELWVKTYIERFIDENSTTVEVGAGSGRISQWVIPMVKTAYLTDYSAYACEILRNKFPTAKVHEVSHCKLTPIADNSVDLVYSISVFGHLLPEQVYTYFRESFAKLKSGGHISIHLTDMTTDVQHFVDAIPLNVDTQRNLFRYLHPDYAVLFAEHIGFEACEIVQADNTRAYFLIARKP